MFEKLQVLCTVLVLTSCASGILMGIIISSVPITVLCTLGGLIAAANLVGR